MSWSELFDVALETPRVLLRPLAREDRAALARIAFEPEIWRFFVVRVDDEAALDRFLEAAVADRAARRRAAFAVIDKASGRLAGSTAFGALSEPDLRLEIGWTWLGLDFRGGGVNREAKRALLAHAFETLGCERVEFKTDALNEPARRALRGIGAVEEGTLRGYNPMPDGRRRDAVYYSILRREWPAVRERLSGVAAPG